MLGIESEISIQGEVSRLSISSNPSRDMKEKNGSLASPSTLVSERALSANSTNNAKNQKIKELRNKMQQVARKQQEMETRMKGYVGMIQKQLKKKEEQNRQLQNVIGSLKEELFQSRNDLEILANYLTKKMHTASRDETKTLRYSNASSKQGEIQVKKNETIQFKQKSPSPKPRLIPIDKSKNQSPHSRQEKKANISGTVSSPFQRKLKSPGK